jgi:uncharacterized membrane protein
MKKFFVKGLIALLPLVLTAALLYLVVGFLYSHVGVPIGEALKWTMGRVADWTPETPEHAWFYSWGAPFLGFCVGIVLTLVVGFFAATFFGKKLFQWFEALLRRLPVVRTVYPYAKQFTDFFFASGGERRMDFKHAVAVPFPAYGIYSIGFVTGEGLKALNEATRKHMVCVFVPTAPTPFTGFVIYVPREDVVPLPVSVEEAMRIIISAGVLHPGHQAVATLPLPGAPGAHLPLPEELAKRLGEKLQTPP